MIILLWQVNQLCQGDDNSGDPLRNYTCALLGILGECPGRASRNFSLSFCFSLFLFFDMFFIILKLET